MIHKSDSVKDKKRKKVLVFVSLSVKTIQKLAKFIKCIRKFRITIANISCVHEYL